MFDFSGKTVLITGASMGLGEGFALGFADAGADLVLTARSADLLEAVAERCRAKGSHRDRRARRRVGRGRRRSRRRHRRRGSRPDRRARQQRRRSATCAAWRPSRSTWRRGTGSCRSTSTGRSCTCATSGVTCCESGGGSIVNICSIMGHGANELNVIAYTAAKGALRNLTLQLGCEWADRGVRVNSVSPGFIVTEMVRPALEGMGMDRWIAEPHADASDRRARRDRRAR